MMNISFKKKGRRHYKIGEFSLRDFFTYNLMLIFGSTALFFFLVVCFFGENQKRKIHLHDIRGFLFVIVKPVCFSF